MRLPANKTKIVCTIGPASESVEVIEQMIRAGMNVARLNFSHGDFVSHKKVIENIRAASRAAGRRVAIMADLPGPKMRIGQLAEEPIELAQQKAVIEKTLDVFARADVVVTNRLHGFIFSLLYRKAVVILPTTDHKLTASMHWFRDLPYVVLAETPNDVPALVERCLAVEEREMPDWNEKYFDRLPEMLGLASDRSRSEELP